MKLISVLMLILFSFASIEAKERSSFIYGFSEKEGIFSELNVRLKSFRVKIGLFYKDDLFNFNNFTFISPFFQMGPISFRGFIKEHENYNSNIFPFKKRSAIFVSEKLSSKSNYGLMFPFHGKNTALCVFRKENTLRMLLWKNASLGEYFELDAIQSVSLPLIIKEEKSWYIEKYEIKSLFNFNESLSLTLSLGGLKGAIFMSFAGSPYDQPGFSSLLLLAYKTSRFYLQNEIKYSSPFFRTSDLKYPQYPYLYKGLLKTNWELCELSNKVFFSLGSKPYVKKSRRWELESKNSFKFQNKLWRIKINGTFSLFNNSLNDLLFEYNLSASLRRIISQLSLELGSKIFDFKKSIFSFYLTSIYRSSSIEFKIKSKVNIKTYINMDQSFHIKIKEVAYSIPISFSITKISLYKHDPKLIKFDFSIAMKIALNS